MPKNKTKIYNSGNSYSKAPEQYKSPTKGKVVTGGDLRSRKSKKK